MTGQDNETIVTLIQSGQGNRNELLTELWENNIGLVRKIIHQLTGLDRKRDRQDFEDLEQQAFLGIIDAISGYNATTGYKFFTYATSYIRKSVHMYYDRAGQTMRIPAYMQARIRKYYRAKRKIESEGRKASSDSIREITGLTERAFRETENAICKIELKSLDCYLQESDPEMGTLLDMIMSHEDIEQSVTDSIYEKELHEILRLAIGTLTQKEREIINFSFFQGYSRKSLAHIYDTTTHDITNHLLSAYKRIRTGKYGKELATFLPERSSQVKTKRIDREIEKDKLKLSDKEKELLL